MSEENNKGPISFDFDQAKVTTQQSLEMEDADASGQELEEELKRTIEELKGRVIEGEVIEDEDEFDDDQ